MIIVMAGLPGTGKSTLARELARRTAGRVLSKDEFRHALFAPEEIEYSTRQDDFCLELMLQTAGYLLGRDPARMILLDGRSFSRRYQITNVVTAATSLHQPWRILECVCSDESVRQRLEADAHRGEHPAENRDYALYSEVKARFEEILHPKAMINTDESLDICAEVAMAALTNPD
ncbi:MAG: ATP-binding protein [Acidobacteriia bacterium]|nr:ATP-binding protein [Terriglobia bacterium]